MQNWTAAAREPGIDRIPDYALIYIDGILGDTPNIGMKRKLQTLFIENRIIDAYVCCGPIIDIYICITPTILFTQEQI